MRDEVCSREEIGGEREAESVRKKADGCKRFRNSDTRYKAGVRDER